MRAGDKDLDSTLAILQLTSDSTGHHTRHPTTEEAEFLDRQLKRLQKQHALGRTVLRGIALVSAAGSLYIGLLDWGSLTMTLLLLVTAMVVWIMAVIVGRKAKSRRTDQIICGDFRCITKIVETSKGSYSTYWVGGLQVYPWLDFWPDGQVVHVELCPLILEDGSSSEAVLVSLPEIDVNAARFAGDPPNQKPLVFIAALIVLGAGYLSWTFNDLDAAELQAAFESPATPPRVGVMDLSKPALRLKTLQLESAHRLIHPWSGSALLDLTQEDAVQIQQVLDQKLEVSQADIEAVINATDCMGTKARMLEHSTGVSEVSGILAIQDIIASQCKEKAKRQLERTQERKFQRSKVEAVDDYLSKKNIYRFLDSVGIGSIELLPVVQEMGLIDEEGRWQSGKTNTSLEDVRVPALLVFLGLVLSGFAVREHLTQVRTREAWNARVRDANIWLK